MKKFSKKSVLLFAGAMAVCAFVMPSMTSAASWGIVGSHHTLDSPGLGFSHAATGMTGQCTNASLTTTVANVANLTITTGTFGNCTTRQAGQPVDCTATWRGTGFPWRATAVTMTRIEIHDIHIDITYEDMPGRPGSCSSALIGLFPTTFTGTLSGGHWSGNGAGQHEVVWTNGTGLSSNLGGGFGLQGTFRDTQQTLTVQGDGC